MSRHANTGRKLSRNTSHRKALLDNLVRAVINYESIRTTTPKAKEAKRVVERIITKAKPGTLAARRLVHKTVRDQATLAKLFDTIAPRFAARPGGYTRLMRTGYRKGDSAELAMVELVGSEFDPNAKAETPAEEAKPKSKGVGGRLRAAAERLRGKKEDHESGGKKVTAKPSKGAGAGRRATTPRKAGGS